MTIPELLHRHDITLRDLSRITGLTTNTLSNPRWVLPNITIAPRTEVIRAKLFTISVFEAHLLSGVSEATIVTIRAGQKRVTYSVRVRLAQGLGMVFSGIGVDKVVY